MTFGESDFYSVTQMKTDLIPTVRGRQGFLTLAMKKDRHPGMLRLYGRCAMTLTQLRRVRGCDGPCSPK